MRGEDLEQASPAQLLAFATVFGQVQNQVPALRADKAVPRFPAILCIGNVKDAVTGKAVTQFALSEPMQSDDDMRYNLVTKCPVWHTDGTLASNPPICQCLFLSSTATDGRCYPLYRHDVPMRHCHHKCKQSWPIYTPFAPWRITIIILPCIFRDFPCENKPKLPREFIEVKDTAFRF